jgi:hypothetical protein
MALQPRHRSRCAEHAGDHGRGRLRRVHHFLLLLFEHVHFRLVPRSRDQGKLQPHHRLCGSFG